MRYSYDDTRCPVKLEVLEAVEGGAETSNAVAGEIDKSIQEASTKLNKYWKEGLLARRKVIGRNKYIYRLTESGNNRLEFLREEVGMDGPHPDR